MHLNVALHMSSTDVICDTAAFRHCLSPQLDPDDSCNMRKQSPTGHLFYCNSLLFKV